MECFDVDVDHVQTTPTHPSSGQSLWETLLVQCRYNKFQYISLILCIGIANTMDVIMTAGNVNTTPQFTR